LRQIAKEEATARWLLLCNFGDEQSVCALCVYRQSGRFEGFRVLAKPRPAERGRILTLRPRSRRPASAACAPSPLPKPPQAASRNIHELIQRRNGATISQLRSRLPIRCSRSIGWRRGPLQMKQETAVPAVAGAGGIHYLLRFDARNVAGPTWTGQDASIGAAFQCNVGRILGKACGRDKAAFDIFSECRVVTQQ